MSVTLKLRNVWRILRDVNLEAMRANAEARFILALVADDVGDAERLRALLSPQGEAEPHPWLVAASASAGLPVLPQKPLFAVLVSRGSQLSPAMTALAGALQEEGLGLVTVLVGGSGEQREVLPAPGAVARLAAPAIDTRLARELASSLVRAAGPAWRLALARQLPIARPVVFQTLTEETAQANASYALTTGLAEVIPVLTVPMNLGDMIVLTKNQLVMSYQIALAAGLDADPRTLIPEILGVLGGGLLFRQLARQLVGFIPAIGLAPKVAVAYGGTQAIGRAIAAWATEGRAVSGDLLQRYTREGLERGRDVARTLLDRARRASGPAARRRDVIRTHLRSGSGLGS